MSTRAPGLMASLCISSVAEPYSRSYSTLTTSAGSLPSLRTGTKPTPRAYAIGAPKMKPRDSMPTTTSTGLPWILARSPSTALLKESPSLSSVVMSLSRIPGFGKSGMSRMRAPRSLGAMAATGERLRQRVRSQLRDRAMAAEPEGQIELGDEVREELAHADLAAGRERVGVRPADADRARAEREGLERIRAAADATVEEHRDPAGDRGHDPGQCVERRDRAIDLAAAVIRDDESVDAVLQRGARRPGGGCPSAGSAASCARGGIAGRTR